jgi:hypothetical protein
VFVHQIFLSGTENIVSLAQQPQNLIPRKNNAIIAQKASLETLTVTLAFQGFDNFDNSH